MPAPSHTRLKRLGLLGGVLLTTFLGLAFLTLNFGSGLADWSYDLPFLSRMNVRAPEAVIVFLDQESQQRLEQKDGRWDRSLHTRLLDRLAREEAALVFCDVFFESERDPATDRQLAGAIRRQGRVVLGSRFVETSANASGEAGAATLELRQPSPLLREGAAGVGLMMLAQESIQRRLFTGTPEIESATWMAARLAGASVPTNSTDRLTPRWLNFHGPAYQLASVSLSQALEPDGLPANYFRGKFVFVGGHPAVFPGEKFATPYNRFTRNDSSPTDNLPSGHARARLDNALSSGVEIHATAFLNLLRGDWLRRIPILWQVPAVILCGLALGGGLLRLRPWLAAVTMLAACAFIAAVSVYLQWHRQLWWSWLVPVAVQAPVALLWSVGYQYAVEGRRRRQLQRAFGMYLPQHLARRVADSDFDPALGGVDVEATVLFTDLEGFTAMSEKLQPRDVARILTSYFNQTTRHIHEQDGAIIKYIGDAVMAVWGAPLAVENPAEHAVLAACGIIESGRGEFHGHRLRTRIGIHSGRVLAGNLGSDFRFDYTVIGATTNLASRLEGMNRDLGTDILVTGATRRQLSERIRVRHLGKFLAKGISEPFRVFEILGVPPALDAAPAWVTTFEQGVTALERRDWDTAERCFQQVNTARAGADGPSLFHLEFLARLRRDPAAAQAWDGVIRLHG